jgi:putative membrane protein
MNTTNVNPKQDKLFFRITMTLTVVVLLAVIVLNRKILPTPDLMPEWTYFLPKLNATINATCSLLLLLSFYFIKKKNIAAHKMVNLITFVLSAIFLVSYVLFHWLAPETRYPDNGMRLFYLIILISHIILAALVLPLILLSFYRGLQMQVALHKKIVRFAFPIWLYVTITGVIVYLMISPYYPI